MPTADDGHHSHGYAEAALTADDVEFDASDAALLRAIEDTGSVAAAAAALERSRARALRRIETLEAAFGGLVERQRGGSGGGGSRLTDAATRLLDRYDRLVVALDATAQVPETVLTGTVTATDGELATVRTPIGTLRGLQDATTTGERVQVRIGADAVTLHEPTTAPEPDATSARNRVQCQVVSSTAGETIYTVALEAETAKDSPTLTALITPESIRRLDLTEGDTVIATWKATATRVLSAHDTAE